MIPAIERELVSSL